MPRLPDSRFAPDCTIDVDGRPVPARAGESVAAALLGADRLLVARSAKYHRPRGAFCLSGSCHACLARIDGVPNQRTCRVACRPGLSVESQHAVPTATNDLLAAIDMAYAHGLDHHHLLTWNAVANRAAVSFSRRLAGTGTLASAPPTARTPASEERFDALVVGAGPAGLGAAEAIAQCGGRVLLAESDRVLGGRLRCEIGSRRELALAWSAEVRRAIAAAGGETCTGLTAVGVWPDAGSSLVVLRSDTLVDALRLVRASNVVIATGTYALPPVVPRNDLPGIFAARGVIRTLAEDGIVPGRRCVVAGGPERSEVSGQLRRAGCAVVEVPDVDAASGGRRLRAVVIAGERIDCDALIWCGPRAPASELVRQAGVSIDLDEGCGGWRIRADRHGVTSTPGLRAAGEVVAPMDAADAAAAGRRAGEAAHGDR